MPRPANPRGFSLVEAAVAIAVVAILSGMLAPLALKALNQQRESKTRDNLKVAFEAMFGARDRRVANMRADFGFDPSASTTYTLRVLVNRAGTAWAPVPAYGYNGANFLRGWNGPYWNGTLDAAGNPADGWGRALRLSVNAGTWQAASAGADGAFGTGDDLAYPSSASGYLAQSATLNVVVTRISTAVNGTASLSFTYGNDAGAMGRCTPSLTSVVPVGNLATTSRTMANTATQTLNFNLPAGSFQITFSPGTGATFSATTLTLDLLPGETRQLDVQL